MRRLGKLLLPLHKAAGRVDNFDGLVLEGLATGVGHPQRGVRRVLAEVVHPGTVHIRALS